MKRIIIIGLVGLISLFLVNSCGQSTQTTKPDGKTDQKPSYDKMNDTAFENVMGVLRESLENEKKAGADSASMLQTAKAYILLIKFIHTDSDKVKKAGMNEDDIKFLVDDASDKAKTRLKDIIGSQTAPKVLKDEAQIKLKELE